MIGWILWALLGIWVLGVTGTIVEMMWPVSENRTKDPGED